MRTIRRKRVWPYWIEVDISFGVIVPAYADWDEDTLFDVVEVMHDLISRPVDGRYHDYA